ncbi:MAG: 50S ribosomal protein L10 [Patescibacteria group bacterium]|nr:50S ribosomal protein L10 [Patescibacteria group bacterium]
MANQKNIDIVSSLSEKLSRAKSVVLTDYRGLTHKQSEELHRAVKKVGGEYVIAKNSLLKIACLPAGRPVPNLTEPTGALLAYDDALAPLKELFKTVKTLGIPKVKFGFIENKEYSGSEIETIAKIPSREILLGQLVFTLNYNIQQLAYVLDQVKNQKSKVKNSS